ncbi:hypothetical protein WH47_02049 [Habropoda laboriosa]|uniref:Uncharacterized protein n=1 Tax=Habropoda laboriosa TaxID=597456 RepID=A0A0L7QZK5_9HYME|nr:hypothetical protein WH47_02049 [Habropoda laboriosa]
MPPTTPTDSAMCSLCPRSKKAQHPKKLVRFDSIVDTFSISDSNAITNQRVRRLNCCKRGTLYNSPFLCVVFPAFFTYRRFNIFPIDFEVILN